MWLTGVVVVVAGASWVLNSGSGRGVESPVATASTTPIVVDCGVDQLQIGAGGDCVSVTTSSVPSCRQGGGMFEALLTLQGANEQYRVYINLLSGYHGAGDYVVNSPAGAFAYVRDYATGALWQSVGGVLAVSGGGHPYGTLDANFGFVGSGDPPTAPVTVAGTWQCA
jgi:hypothetical protein